jgi:hypothetical protein
MIHQIIKVARFSKEKRRMEKTNHQSSIKFVIFSKLQFSRARRKTHRQVLTRGEFGFIT